jgi:hypothetical protein
MLKMILSLVRVVIGRKAKLFRDALSGTIQFLVRATERALLVANFTLCAA